MQEVLLREYEESGQTMQEWRIVSISGKEHIVVQPKKQQPEPELQEPIVDKFAQLKRQNLIILDALADLLAEYPLPEARKTEVDIYTELIEAGRRELKDVPEALKEAVGKEIGGEVIDKK